MPDDKRFIFDQVTWILLFGEFCVIVSGNQLGSNFKLDHWLLKLGKHSQYKFYAAFSSIKF